MLKRLLVALVLVGAPPAIAPTALAQKAPVFTEWLSDLAVGGYDAVAYFTEHKAVAGDDKFATRYKGAKFRFSSQANLDAFLKQPDLYAPQFGGYCAWAVSQGYTAKGDPNFWRIENGKLYLNYNRDVQKKWEADIPGLIAKGNANWPDVLNK